MRILEWIRQFFSVGGWSDALVYLAICGVFIIGIIKCVIPVARTRGVLQRASGKIREGSSGKGGWQDAKFLGKGALYPHWSEYLNNLFFADGEYHNASNVEDYINEETVIYGPGRQAFADAVPGLLVSLGFLGTLIGLASGLSGFDMANANAVQSSIATLIPGMRYAFNTSIVGVVGSILFTVISRAVNGSTQRVLRIFYGAMSRHAGVLSVDPMTQIAIYQQEQTALIQTMAKDLNGSFTQHISEALAQSIEPVNQTLKNFITVTTKEQMRLLDAVAQRFVERTEGMMQGELENLAEMLRQTSRRQMESFKSVDASMAKAQQAFESMERASNVTNELTNAFNRYMTSLTTHQNQMDEAYVRVSGNVERMDVISRQQTRALKDLTDMATDVSDAVEKMRQTISEYTNAMDTRQRDAGDAMSKAADELKAAGQEIAAIHTQTAESMDRELKDTLDSFADYVTQFNKRVEYLASSIANSLSELPKAVDDTSEQLLDQIERMASTLRDAQRALDDAVDRMYGHGSN